MNILAIVKFPPIQGGESRNAFFLFDELGKRGHDITILTNYDEVPSKNKMSFSENDFQILGTNLALVSVKSESTPDFIPQYDPKTEKLISEGIKIISSKKIDLIYGWYLLPYVSAAYLLSAIYSIPLVIQHAGSDMTRLYPKKTLKSYFDNIFQASAGIITYSSTVHYFKNINPKKLLKQQHCFPDIYNPEGKQIDFIKEYKIEHSYNSIFLCLGKFSLGKGFYEIIESFRLINYAALLILSPNWKSISIDLPKNVYLMDAAPPWKIPSIIRSSTALIVPEWNFGVPVHQSVLPIESILCGKVALVSNQILKNYDELAQFMIGIEPRNLEDTIKKIKQVIQNGSINEKVRNKHNYIRNKLPQFSAYVDDIESFLENRSKIGSDERRLSDL